MTQKSIRILKFLRGLGNPRSKRAMQQFGFSQADFDEGWSLMQKAARGGPSSSIQGGNQLALEQLDVWEDKWFPIIKLSLRRHHPDLCDRLFDRLGQTEGLEVTVTVSTLLDRLNKERGTAEGDAALALLATRGCNQAELAEAERLLTQFGKMALDNPDPITEAEAYKQAQQDAWDWYLEWSGIARHVVKDRRALRSMGFLQNTSSDDDERSADTIPPESGITGIDEQDEAAEA